MKPDSPQHDSPTLSDDQLDRLLASAKAPKPSWTQKRKMRRWLKSLLVQTRPGAQWTMRPTVALACLLLLALGGWLLYCNGEFQGNRPSSQEFAIALPHSQPDAKSTSESGARRTRPKKRSKRRRSKRRGIVSDFVQDTSLRVASSQSGLACFKTWIQFLDQPTFEDRRFNHPRNSKTLQLARKWRRDFEQNLVRSIRQSQSDWRVLESERFAQQLRLLCEVASQDSLPVVLEFLPFDRFESQIMRAAFRCGDSKVLGNLAYRIGDPGKRTSLLTELLNRGDRESFGIFLEIACKLDSFSIVQTSASAAQTLPLNFLFEALLSNRIQTSRIAATALSTQSESSISNRLLQLAEDPRTVRPAIFAIVARKDQTSTQFIDWALQDLNYRAIVQSESKNWRRLAQSTLVVSTQKFTPLPRP